MSLRDRWTRRLRREEDLDEEIRSHLRLAAEEHAGRGESIEQARDSALREFGNVDLVKEVTRDVWGRRWLDAFLRDQRYGLRMLRKNPAFTVVAILTLALGIGANTAIFSVVNGVLLRPLPYPDPDRLVMLYESGQGFEQGSVAYPNFVDWRRESRSFTDMAVSRRDDFNYTGTGQPEHLSGVYASSSFFRVLGVTPVLGRDFLPEEDRPGVHGVALLSYGLWQRRFGGSTAILGKSMTLNADSYTIIGVLPPAFRFQGQADVYVPVTHYVPISLNDRQNHPGLSAVARLKTGVNIAAARSEMDAFARRLAQEYPQSNQGRGIAIVEMKRDIVGFIRPTLLLLFGAVGFVLLVACTNVANLMLARSNARSREFAIRLSLGAARGRVIAQLLTESVQLTLAAAALGLLVSQWGTRLVLAAVPRLLPRSEEVALDTRVLLFTLAVSILTGVLFGLVPAFRSSHLRPHQSLKEGAREGGGGRRLEGLLVAVEVCVAAILLAGAGLMMQSIWRLWRIDTGFETRNLLTTQVAITPSVMSSPSGIRLAYRQMLNRVSAIPDVRSAAMTSLVPLGGLDSEIFYWMGNRPQPPQNETSLALIYIVTSDYLRVMGIPLKAGRFITEEDTLSRAPVIVVDEVMARDLFPGQDAVGKQVSLMILGPVQIVGVVGHVKHWGLDSDDGAKLREQIYFSFYQVPDQFMSLAVAGVTLALRTRSDPLSVVSAVRDQVAGPTADQPIFGVQTMEQIISVSLAERRFMMMLLTIFAATALALAAAGIYGVMSYAVSRRTHELGVRMALGASRPSVLRLVVREGMVFAAAGMAAGTAASLALTRFMANLLYGVRPTDPATFAVVSLLLAGVALAACYLPAWRAARVDPMTALRCE